MPGAGGSAQRLEVCDGAGKNGSCGFHRRDLSSASNHLPKSLKRLPGGNPHGGEPSVSLQACPDRKGEQLMPRAGYAVLAAVASLIVALAAWDVPWWVALAAEVARDARLLYGMAPHLARGQLTSSRPLASGHA